MINNKEGVFLLKKKNKFMLPHSTIVYKIKVFENMVFIKIPISLILLRTHITPHLPSKQYRSKYVPACGLQSIPNTISSGLYKGFWLGKFP